MKVTEHNNANKKKIFNHFVGKLRFFGEIRQEHENCVNNGSEWYHDMLNNPSIRGFL